jgi:hypothetical protein
VVLEVDLQLREQEKGDLRNEGGMQVESQPREWEKGDL